MNGGDPYLLVITVVPVTAKKTGFEENIIFVIDGISIDGPNFRLFPRLRVWLKLIFFQTLGLKIFSLLVRTTHASWQEAYFYIFDKANYLYLQN